MFVPRSTNIILLHCETDIKDTRERENMQAVMKKRKLVDVNEPGKKVRIT